jgi:hypothetical protein
MLLLTLCPTLGKRFGNTTFAHWPPGPWAAPGPAGRLEVDLRLDAMLGIAIFDIRLKNGVSLVSSRSHLSLVVSIDGVVPKVQRNVISESAMQLTIQSPVANDGEKFSPQPEKWGAGW